MRGLLPGQPQGRAGDALSTGGHQSRSSTSEGAGPVVQEVTSNAIGADHGRVVACALGTGVRAIDAQLSESVGVGDPSGTGVQTQGPVEQVGGQASEALVGVVAGLAVQGHTALGAAAAVLIVAEGAAVQTGILVQVKTDWTGRTH